MRANTPARQPYSNLVPSTVLPPGSVLVESISGAPCSDEHYVMEKLGDGSWRFLVVKPDGTMDRGANAPLCQRCHAEAVADGLFGIPHPLDKNSRPDRAGLSGLGAQKEKSQIGRQRAKEAEASE